MEGGVGFAFWGGWAAAERRESLVGRTCARCVSRLGVGRTLGMFGEWYASEPAGRRETQMAGPGRGAPRPVGMREGLRGMNCGEVRSAEPSSLLSNRGLGYYFRCWLVEMVAGVAVVRLF